MSAHLRNFINKADVGGLRETIKPRWLTGTDLWTKPNEERIAKKSLKVYLPRAWDSRILYIIASEKWRPKYGGAAKRNWPCPCPGVHSQIYPIATFPTKKGSLRYSLRRDFRGIHPPFALRAQISLRTSYEGRYDCARQLDRRQGREVS